MFSCCLNYVNYKQSCISYLSIEEIRVTLELLGQSLIRLSQKFGFVANSLQEGIVDLVLDVIVVVSGFFSLVIFKESLDLLLKFVLFLIKIHDYIVIVLFLFIVDCLQILELLSESSQFLDLWG